MSENALPEKQIEGSIYKGKLREFIDLIPEEILNMSEESLRERINPTLRLYQCKILFHKETLAAQKEGRPFMSSNAIRGVINQTNFHKDILRHPLKLAWVLSPLITYENATRAALFKATERYEELVSMEVTITKRKKVDGEWVEYKETCPRKVMALMYVIKNLEDRIKGMAIQRQITIGASKPTEEATATSLNMEAIENKLKELENKLGGDDGDREVCSDANGVGKGTIGGYTEDQPGLNVPGTEGPAGVVIEVESKIV